MANDDVSEPPGGSTIDPLVTRAAGLVDAAARNDPRATDVALSRAFFPLASSPRRTRLIRSFRQELRSPGWSFHNRRTEVLEEIVEALSRDVAHQEKIASDAEENKTGTWNYVIAAARPRRHD